VILRCHVHHSAAISTNARNTPYIHHGRPDARPSALTACSPPERLVRLRFEISGSPTFTAITPRAPPASTRYRPGFCRLTTFWSPARSSGTTVPSCATTRVTLAGSVSGPDCVDAWNVGRASHSSALPTITGNAGANARFESVTEKPSTMARRSGRSTIDTSGVPFSDRAITNVPASSLPDP
jgi:hypothetical protein